MDGARSAAAAAAAGSVPGPRVARLGILSPNLAKLAKSGPPSAKFIFDSKVCLAKFQPLSANTGKYFLAIFDPV